MELSMQETSGPYLVARDGVWQATGWIRGTWLLHFYGDSPSGLCTLSANVDGQTVPGSSSPANPSMWHQCSASAVNQPVNTTKFLDGPRRISINARDAANAY